MRGKEESLEFRLRVMVSLAPGMSDGSAEHVKARLNAAGFGYEVDTVRSHLDGETPLTSADKVAYAAVCQWHDDTSLLADDPETYMLPLVQAEILLSIRLIGMPQSRGSSELQALEWMSVNELRHYRDIWPPRRRRRLAA